MWLYDKSASFSNNGAPNADFLAYTSGGNIIDEPILAKFDNIKDLPLIRLEPISRRVSTVTHTDDPFSAARFSTRLNFGGPLTLILSALSLHIRNWLRSVPTSQDILLAADVFKILYGRRVALSLWPNKWAPDLLPILDLQGTGTSQAG